MTAAAPIAFTPALVTADPRAAYWMRQAMLRLRREVCWLWQERTGIPQTDGLPPFGSRTIESLDLSRFFEEKLRFFANDPAAAYLTERIAEPEPDAESPFRGSFAWAVRELALPAVDRLALGFAMLASFDGAAGPVLATCANDAARTLPSLGLLQRMWHRPEEVLRLRNPAHPLFRYGLLRRAEGPFDWESGFSCPETVVQHLLSGESPALEESLNSPVPPSAALHHAARILARSRAAGAGALRVSPLFCPHGGSADRFLDAVAQASGRPILRLPLQSWAASLPAALTLCWLTGRDLAIAEPASAKLAAALSNSWGIPVTLFVPITERAALEGLPTNHLLSPVEIPRASFGDRLAQWRDTLGPRISEHALAETARRFRFEPETIQQIAAGLLAQDAPVTEAELTSACRSARAADLGELAQRVVPRFDRAADLFLPDPQREHFQEVLQAMRALTEVHYRWGAARLWNEAGVAVLFAGPPGTGKTMAAEILASELDLPMYRIDLSQVVNKYIGETEKNLKRIFDAADLCDTLLLFDEADSIFGKRTEARDAHDRYANLEVSYLLERMERFKGLAVLATNRKKDLDEAFLRRLRYILDFPLPGVTERRRIWEQSIPPHADGSALDLDLLAANFAVSGGHIRSAVFNACLQSASGGPARLSMEHLVVALKRELDKLNRPVATDLFGPWAHLVRRMEHEADHSY